MFIKRNPAPRGAWGQVMKFFGNKDNQAVELHLRELSTAARDCAEKLRVGLDMNLDEITEDEHRGDNALEELSYALERGFILRATINKADSTHLGHELDDVIDGMRDVAEHIATYRRFLPELPSPAAQLIDMVHEGIVHLDSLVHELTNGRIDFDAMNEHRARISELERQADRTKRDAIRALVSSDFDDPREFIAQRELIELLEGITDHTKHCAVIVVSMARQEA